MMHKPLCVYNKTRSCLLLPALASTLVINCRSISTTPITATSVPPGGTTIRPCTGWSLIKHIYICHIVPMCETVVYIYIYIYICSSLQ